MHMDGFTVAEKGELLKEMGNNEYKARKYAEAL